MDRTVSISILRFDGRDAQPDFLARGQIDNRLLLTRNLESAVMVREDFNQPRLWLRLQPRLRLSGGQPKTQRGKKYYGRGARGGRRARSRRRKSIRAAVIAVWIGVWHGYWVMYLSMSRASSSVSVARTLMWRTIVAVARGENLCGAWWQRAQLARNLFSPSMRSSASLRTGAAATRGEVVRAFPDPPAGAMDESLEGAGDDSACGAAVCCCAATHDAPPVDPAASPAAKIARIKFVRIIGFLRPPGAARTGM
jgi:hypothetical protein